MSFEAKKILVIDDEKELCSLLKEFFLGEGYAVECAHDGSEGIVKIQTFNPDIIILDHRMPVMDGPTMLKQAKAICSAPVICISALESKDTPIEYLRLGVKKFLTKPLDLEELSQAIVSTLEGK
ncbi:MAG: DNA-binding response OmpR family regulator [Nitrospinales bacterium]|jgi:DNA-binding response OmpR family regulator